MYDVAQLRSYKVDEAGTHLYLLLPGRNLMDDIETHQIRRAGVELHDGRSISPDQRKKAYATLKDLADYTGDLPEVMKEWMKYRMIAQAGCDYFSLSDCSMDTARRYINTILDFALEHGVILSDLGLNRTDDINAYLYSCLMHRRCAICGRDGEIHHWDAIGMGHDRDKVDDRNHRKICLCREHHTEAHTIGRDAFGEKYHVYGIVIGGWVRLDERLKGLS